MVSIFASYVSVSTISPFLLLRLLQQNNDTIQRKIPQQLNCPTSLSGCWNNWNGSDGLLYRLLATQLKPNHQNMCVIFRCTQITQILLGRAFSFDWKFTNLTRVKKTLPNSVLFWFFFLVFSVFLNFSNLLTCFLSSLQHLHDLVNSFSFTKRQT